MASRNKSDGPKAGIRIENSHNCDFSGSAVEGYPVGFEVHDSTNIRLGGASHTVGPTPSPPAMAEPQKTRGKGTAFFPELPWKRSKSTD